MAWLRHAPRHIHATIVDYLTAQLTALGWLDSTQSNRPFGAPQVRIQSFLPPESELTKVTAGLVAVTLGDEGPAFDEELGGPLHSQDYSIFVDCFMDKEAHVTALATDVRDIFRGRMTDAVRSMPVQDHSQDPAVDVDGWRMEFIDLERVRFDILPIYWQSVRFTAAVDFPEVIY